VIKQRGRRRFGCIGIVVAVMLVAGLILDRIAMPSDEAMIRRFMGNRNALESVYQADFVSDAARKRWLRALRIRKGFPAWRLESGGHFEVYIARIPLGFGGFVSKGYAFQADLENLLELRPVNSLDDHIPSGYSYRHIEGNWYLYSLRSE
jgi:hypothetical protein